jgi:hypothetical protein
MMTDPEEVKKAYLEIRDLPNTGGVPYIEVPDDAENIEPVSTDALTEIREAMIRAIFNK